jgi:Acyl-CoA carboxylase epsilon subunit
VRPFGLRVGGGTPTPQELAALTAALSALLDGERREVPDRAALAYGSRWRRAGIEAAVRPFVARRGA